MNKREEQIKKNRKLIERNKHITVWQFFVLLFSKPDDEEKD